LGRCISRIANAALEIICYRFHSKTRPLNQHLPLGILIAGNNLIAFFTID
jgi:hypothetical protein